MKSKHRSPKSQVQHALERAQPALEAITEREIEPVRHDITNASISVLGISRGVQKYRGEVRVQIGQDAAKHFDALEDAAFACAGAQAQHLIKLHGITIETTVADLNQQRRILLAEAQTLVSKRLLPASALAELVGGTGQKALCLDVLQLTAAFRGHWPALHASTAVTTAELDQAESLASALATALGENEQGTSPVAPTAEQRARAYTYFVRTYDEVRRAMHFIRWDEGDADEIAPSLSAGRTRHPADTTPVQTGPVVPIVPVTSAPAVATTNGAAPTAAPGTPSAQPFVTTP